MSKTSIPRPSPADHAPYYARYIQLVPDGDLIAHLERQGRETVAMLRGISEKQSRHRYAADKWSIREVVGHVSDAERVFGYRALSFARGDATPLPSFDENAWGAATNADSRELADLIDEFEAVRAATVALLRGFSEVELKRSGTASNNPVTVPALAYIVAGHELHHVRILRERYLSA